MLFLLQTDVLPIHPWPVWGLLGPMWGWEASRNVKDTLEGIPKKWEIAPSQPAQKRVAEPSHPQHPSEGTQLGEIRQFSAKVELVLLQVRAAPPQSQSWPKPSLKPPNPSPLLSLPCVVVG